MTLPHATRVLPLELRMCIANAGALLSWLTDIGDTQRAAVYHANPELPILLQQLNKLINIPAQQKLHQAEWMSDETFRQEAAADYARMQESDTYKADKAMTQEAFRNYDHH